MSAVVQSPKGSKLPEERQVPAGPVLEIPEEFDIPDISRPKVKGKTVVVTGGSQGSGKDTALLFAKKGYNVVVVARQADRLEAVADEVRNIRGSADSALAVPVSITEPDAVSKLAKEVSERFETVDVLINCAGVCHTGPALETPYEVFKDQIDINYLAHVLVTQAFSSKLIESKGHIVFVNSFGGVIPLKLMSAYSGAKFALAGFADSLRYELEEYGVKVSQVHPGVVDSAFMDRAGWSGQDAEKRKKDMEVLLKGPMTQKPSDVADAVWTAIEKNKNETIVGAFYSTAVSTYRLTGLNVFASRR